MWRVLTSGLRRGCPESAYVDQQCDPGPGQQLPQPLPVGRAVPDGQQLSHQATLPRITASYPRSWDEDLAGTPGRQGGAAGRTGVVATGADLGQSPFRGERERQLSEILVIPGQAMVQVVPLTVKAVGLRVGAGG